MDPITLVVLGITIVATSVIAAINKYQEVKKKNNLIEKYIDTLKTHAETYSFEQADIKIINSCKVYLKNKFCNGYEQEFMKYTTIEDRKVFTQSIAYELASIMGVKVDEIIVEDIGDYTRGATVTEDGVIKIYLNEALMIADPELLVKTICHELKHCVQFQSFTNNIWGYSDAKIASWLYSWEHYHSSDSPESYLPYYYQIIEIDANKTTDLIFSK